MIQDAERRIEELGLVPKYNKCIEEECGHQEFELTTGEQLFYIDRGLTEPKRCPMCRLKRKSQVKTGVPMRAPIEPRKS